MTRSAEDEDKRGNPVKRATSTRSEEAQGREGRVDGKGTGARGTAARCGTLWSASLTDAGPLRSRALQPDQARGGGGRWTRRLDGRGDLMDAEIWWRGNLMTQSVIACCH